MVRENIYASVFAFFSALTVGGSPAFKTATRKLRTWEDVPSEDQPALLQLQVGETIAKTKGLPAKWTLSIELYLYVHTGQLTDTTLVASQLLNPLIDSVVNSLTIDDINNDACTLGGLVSHCYISGTIRTFEGNLGDQAACIIPINLVLAAN